ncbi:MAG: Do family serine endopeptidase, partial [Desulfobacterales bacterium]
MNTPIGAKVKSYPSLFWKMILIGLPFLAAGIVLASGFQWNNFAVAALENKSAAMAPIRPGIPGSFAELAETLSPTVVNVRVTQVEPAVHPGNRYPQAPGGEFFERFFNGLPPMPQPQPRQGAGSGVIISDDGYILTNNHVVAGAAQVTVTLSDKAGYAAEVIGRDPQTDLAVLKIEARHELPAAVLADSETLRVGDWVVAIGNPFGLNHTVTTGIVSAKGRVIGAGPYDDFIQTDASINPGNSGGPLFNMQGEVVGINTAIIPQGQGIGFAIPVNTAKPLIPQLVSRGEVTRGYLGVNIQALTPELAQALKVDNTKGVLVADVVPKSPAARAGIQRGDIILAYNGQTVTESRELPALVAATPVAQEATLTVIRNGKQRQLEVTIGKLLSEQDPLAQSASPE